MPFAFDLTLLERYWVERPAVYHHTAPILHIYALHEALRQVADEGLEARWQRHTEAGRALQSRLIERGFELLAEPEHQLGPLTAPRVPEGVDGKAVQTAMLIDHGIEIGGGLGPAAPPDLADRTDGPQRHGRHRGARADRVRRGNGGPARRLIHRLTRSVREFLT